MTNKPAITEEEVGAPATSSSLPSSPTSFRDTDTPSSQLLRYDQHHSARGISTRALAERCSLQASPDKAAQNLLPSPPSYRDAVQMGNVNINSSDGIPMESPVPAMSTNRRPAAVGNNNPGCFFCGVRVFGRIEDVQLFLLFCLMAFVFACVITWIIVNGNGGSSGTTAESAL